MQPSFTRVTLHVLALLGQVTWTKTLLQGKSVGVGTRGGGGVGGMTWGPGQPQSTDGPTHIRKLFLREKMKSVKRARYLRLVLSTQTFFGL